MRWVKSKEKIGKKAISRCRIPEGVTPLFEHEFEAGDQGLADLKVAFLSISNPMQDGDRIEAWPAFIMSLENLKKRRIMPSGKVEDYYMQVTRLTKFIPVKISKVVNKKKIFSDSQFESLRELIEIYRERHSGLLNFCALNQGPIMELKTDYNSLDINVVRSLRNEKQHWIKAVGYARSEVNMTKKFDLIEPAINCLEALEKALGKLSKEEILETRPSIDNVLLRYEMLFRHFSSKTPVPSDRLSLKLQLKERTRVALFYLKRIPNDRLDEVYDFGDYDEAQEEEATVAGEVKRLAKFTLVLNELLKTFLEEEEIPEIMPFNHFIYNSSRIAS